MVEVVVLVVVEVTIEEVLVTTKAVVIVIVLSETTVPIDIAVTTVATIALASLVLIITHGEISKI